MIRRYFRLPTGLILLIALISELVPVVAQSETTENAHVWRPRTTSVAVFKNGLGFFMREGTVETSNGWARGDSVPPASFGTFAVYSLTENSAVDTIALGPGEILEFDGKQAPDTLEARLEKLKPCVGLNLELTYTLKGKKTTSVGKLVSVSEPFVILETEMSSFAVKIEDIRKLQVLNLPLRIHVQTEKAADAAKADQTKADAPKTDAAKADAQPGKNPEFKLGMAYLRKGIIWIPEYSLKILDDQTAELTLRGTVVNEAEDLIDTDVHLVVGVPHFVHTEFQSPFVVGQAIRSIGVSLAMQNRAQIPAQMMSQMTSNSMQNTYNAAPAIENLAPVPETVPVEQGNTNIQQTLGQLPSLETAGGSDYTVYTRKGLTLRKGERAMLTLFTQKIQYSHVYRWNTEKKMEHSLILNNSTSSAWTTGPCLAISDSQALTEDTLKYTPKGSAGELALTESINVGQGYLRKEIDRKLNAHNINNVSFDLVNLEGTIRLQNFEPREVNIVVTCPINGKVTKASDDGKLVQDASELRLAERKSSVIWNLKLKPGEVKELTYSYERYVRAL